MPTIDPQQAQIFGQSLQNNGLDKLKAMFGIPQADAAQMPQVNPNPTSVPDPNQQLALARQMALQRLAGQQQ